jgi:hypothetical protein
MSVHASIHGIVITCDSCRAQVRIPTPVPRDLPERARGWTVSECPACQERSATTPKPRFRKPGPDPL